MARGQSYNELVAQGRVRLVQAARLVHESRGSYISGLGDRQYTHLNGCAAITRAGAPALAMAHFDRMFDNGHAYYFGSIVSSSHTTNKRRQEQRVFALLLAAASLE